MKTKNSTELEAYKNNVRDKLDDLISVLANTSVGDFSKSVKIPKEEDEFTDLYIGVQLVIDVVREHFAQLEKLNTQLSENFQDVKASSLKIEQEKVIDEAILDGIGEGLIVTDTNAKIIILNRQAEIMLGLRAEEVVGKKLFRVIKATDMNGLTVPVEARPVFIAINRRRKVTNSGLYYSTKNVKELPVAITSSPIFLNRQVIGSVTVIRDVRHEREIDKAKTEVVSFTSHQLRTPLSVINWYSEVLLAGHVGELNDRQREYMEVIMFTARRMIELVNTFLSVSRIQLGTLVMDVKDVDMKELVGSVYEELSQLIDQKQLNFFVNIPEDLPRIIGDPKLIRVVFQNLINNAVKYTPQKGHVSIDASAIKPSDNLPIEEGLLFTIRDTGYGIPRKQQSKIFTKLFRAENAQQVDTEGAGLGLYMVKSIVNYAGGDVWFRSRLNKGTVFFVALPLVPAVKEGTPTA